MNILDWKTRARLLLAYMGTMADWDCPAPAATYAAELALALFGDDAGRGQAFLADPGLFTADPLRLAKDSGATAADVWHAQVQVCLPLLEEERRCFIAAEYGRLLPILGVDYWNAETGEYGVLYKYDIGARIDEGQDDALCLVGDVLDDPYGLSLEALSKLGYLEKRLNMLGTVSYTPFYHMNPADRDRLVLLADWQDRLKTMQILSPDEVSTLFQGHQAFMERE